MKRFLVLIMASVFFASGMPPAESRAAEEYVLSLNLPIPPIHNRWHFALKQWTEELNKRSSGTRCTRRDRLGGSSRSASTRRGRPLRGRARLL